MHDVQVLEQDKVLEQDQQEVEKEQMAEDELVMSLSGIISNKEWQE